MKTYDELYNLIMKEQILSTCTKDTLHQHLVYSKLYTSIKLGKIADKWVRSRVSKKAHGGSDHKMGAQTS